MRKAPSGVHMTPHTSFFLKSHILSFPFFSPILVCAETYNPDDEEEEDADPRVRTKVFM